MTFKTSKTPSTQILRADILEEGSRFIQCNCDCALILEDSKGHKWGVEFIDIKEFFSYMNSFVNFKTQEELSAWMLNKSNDIEEEGIDFSVYDVEILEHLERFRKSEYNTNQLIQSFNN